MSALLALLLSMTPAMNSPDHGCAGGAVIFFDHGSDLLTPAATARLAGYAEASNRQHADSQIYIESGGGGEGSAFDRALSRRRSEQINAFLIAHGLRAGRIHVEIGEIYNRAEPGQSGEPYEYLIGHVYELVSLDEYRRLYPPGLIAECF